MKIAYFKDTDTLLVLSENVLVELDGAGNVVSMTIEHAAQQAEISRISHLTRL